MSSRIRTKVSVHTYEVRCPECDYNLKVKNEKLGRKLICLHMLKEHKIDVKNKEFDFINKYKIKTK